MDFFRASPGIYEKGYMASVIVVNETPKGNRVFHCSMGAVLSDMKVLSKGRAEHLLPKLDEVLQFKAGTYVFDIGEGTEATARWEKVR